MWALILAAVTAGMLLPEVAFAQAATFGSAQTFDVSGVPGAIAVVDVDGDQHVDVITANTDGASISFLPGDGSGDLLFGGDFEAGSVPSGLAIGDFDGDEVSDVIVSNANAATLSFLKGVAGDFLEFQLIESPIVLPGACTLDPAQTCDASLPPDEDACKAAEKGACNGVAGPGAIAVGNLNGDAFLDLAVAGEGNGDGDGTVSILFGGPDGAFTIPAPRTAGTKSTAVAIADLNDDGKNDVVVANKGSDAIAVFLGKGLGDFEARADSSVGAPATGLAVADVDDDGRKDVVISTPGNATTLDGIVVLTGDGSGHFTRQGSFAAGNTASGVALGHLDGDGHLDAVVSNQRSIDASVLLGDGHGNFGPARTFVANGEPVAVAVGDLNEDGRADVVTADSLGSQSGDVAVLMNLDGNRLRGVEDFPVREAVLALTSGDIDNDAWPDIAVTFGSNKARVYLARAAQGFVVTGDLSVGDNPSAVLLADFNQDSTSDLATVNSGDGTVSILLGHGDGTFDTAVAVPAAPKSVTGAAGDFDGNGTMDLAVVSITTAAPPGSSTTAIPASFLLARGEGAALDGDTHYPGSLGARNAAAVPTPTPTPTVTPTRTPTATPVPGVVTILLGNGDGTFHSGGSVTVRQAPQSVAIGHFDADAFPDLAVANSGSDDVTILLGNGDGTFRTACTVTVDRGPIGVAVLDANRDGADDFAVAHMTAQNVRVYTGNCTAGFLPAGFPTSANNSPSGLVVRDLNGNGTPDIAVSNQVSNDVSILVSSSSGRFSRSANIPVSRMPLVITGADFDGDGRYDVATGNASPTALNFSVLTNTGATPALRGDGNADGLVSAADIVAALREVTDGDSDRPEDVGRGGFAAVRGVDANGDGVVTGQDIRATATRVFAGG